MSTLATDEARAELVSILPQHLGKRTENGSAAAITPDDAEALVAAFDKYIDAKIHGIAEAFITASNG